MLQAKIRLPAIVELHTLQSSELQLQPTKLQFKTTVSTHTKKALCHACLSCLPTRQTVFGLFLWRRRENPVHTCRSSNRTIAERKFEHRRRDAKRANQKDLGEHEHAK